MCIDLLTIVSFFRSNYCDLMRGILVQSTLRCDINHTCRRFALGSRVKIPIKNVKRMISTIDEIEAFAKLDLSRQARCGFPEVIFASGKSVEQLIKILVYLMEAQDGPCIATRVTREQFESVREKSSLISSKMTYLSDSGILFSPARKQTELVKGSVALLTAGTSDYSVAEEAAVTLELSGVEKVIRVYDVGVAGIHRLFNNYSKFKDVDVVIACAGMDGALPSVVRGIVQAPVIAVPTSIGYGASLGGVSALLTMLNSCSPGVTTVNIDNGFGAAVTAFKILKTIERARTKE